jgi:hypothetical protein
LVSDGDIVETGDRRFEVIHRPAIPLEASRSGSQRADRSLRETRSMTASSSTAARARTCRLTQRR